MSDKPGRPFATTAEPSAPLPQPCTDCGTDCRIDTYIVRTEVWAEAGMDGWDAGFLCTRHIQKRLGRRLRKGKDLLLWTTSPKGKRRWNGVFLDYHPDYFTRPEWLEHLNNPREKFTKELADRLLLILVGPNSGTATRQLIATGYEEAWVRAAWRFARVAGYTEETGLGADRLTPVAKRERLTSDLRSSGRLPPMETSISPRTRPRPGSPCRCTATRSRGRSLARSGLSPR